MNAKGMRRILTAQRMSEEAYRQAPMPVAMSLACLCLLFGTSAANGPAEALNAVLSSLWL